MMPVCLPDEADWKTTSNKYWGEYTTVTGYGRVDQFVQLFQGRDQRSCRLLKDYLQVKPSYDKACKRVRFISKSFFQLSPLSILVSIPLSFGNSSGLRLLKDTPTEKYLPGLIFLGEAAAILL